MSKASQQKYNVSVQKKKTEMTSKPPKDSGNVSSDNERIEKPPPLLQSKLMVAVITGNQKDVKTACIKSPNAPNFIIKI